MIQKTRQFFIEVIAEVKKVTWSTKKELVGATVVVIIAVLLTTFFIGTVDFVLSKLLAILM
ncbi:MAG: preprotein translocase subunit SecE [bacterium]